MGAAVVVTFYMIVGSPFWYQVLIVQVLYLWLAVLAAMEEELPETPQVIFFDSGDEFGQVSHNQNPGR